MGETKLFVFLSVFLLLLPFTLGCSCGRIYSRSQTICNVYSSDEPVYKVRVTSTYCKCLPSSSRTSFSCVQFYPGRGSQNNTVTGTVKGLYQCGQGSVTYGISYHYGQCNTTINNAGATYSNIMNTTNQMVENVTCLGHYTNGTGCIPTAQPCYYTVIVETVYKGNSIQVGQYLNTSGPDVLTSCGHDGRVLRFNESYIVGIGGTCEGIGSWPTFSSFSSKEINTLELAGQSGTICLTDKHLGIIIGVTVPLVIIVIIIVILVIVIVTICAVWKRKQNQKLQSTKKTNVTLEESAAPSNDNESKVDDDKSGLI